MNKISKIVILRGNSGSGKSVMAKLVQRELGRGTLLISQDAVRREMLWANDGEDTLAIPLLKNLVEYGRKNCEYVILEGILYADWYKEVFQKVIEEYGTEIYAYYYDLPFEETLNRHKTKPNCHDFGEEEMRRWWRDKDYIGIIPEKILSSQDGMDETLKMIVREVRGNVSVE